MPLNWLYTNVKGTSLREKATTIITKIMKGKISLIDRYIVKEVDQPLVKPSGWKVKG